LTLGSDQDNGLAYADTDDPAVHEYFGRVGRDVNDGLARCGIEADANGVLAGGEIWHRTFASWRRVFTAFLAGDDLKLVLNASVCFDYRQSAGRLYVAQALTDVLREAPEHPQFMKCLAQLGSGYHPPVSGLRQKLDRVVDLKQGGLVPVQNLARHHALARGITIQATLDRLAALCALDAQGTECDRTLREAYITLKQLQLEHHAEAVRVGRKPDNTIDTEALRPLTRANLQEALRAVATAQKVSV
jgi:CBS domain-containing protein